MQLDKNHAVNCKHDEKHISVQIWVSRKKSSISQKADQSGRCLFIQQIWQHLSNIDLKSFYWYTLSKNMYGAT